MRAAVTQARKTIRIVDVPDPGEPGEGEVVVRPEAVGLCGSDFHYFLGHIGSVEDSKLYPRIFGHEAAGILDAVGPGCSPELRAGERVAMWPLVACGHCYPCRIGRSNACVNISLIGVHTDGALQDRLLIPADTGIPGRRPRSGGGGTHRAGVHSRPRNRPRPGGGGRAGGRVRRGTDRSGHHRRCRRQGRVRAARRPRAEPARARSRPWEPTCSQLAEGDDPVAAALEWAGGDGPEVVFEATGAAQVARTAVELVAQAGRVVIVGLGHDDVPLRISDLAFKEVDLLGVSCCNAEEFGDAVSLVARRHDVLAGLITHEFPFEQRPRGDDVRDRAPGRGDEGGRAARPRLTGGRALY